MRTEVPSWEETFMEMTHVIAKRSKDPTTQVGAILVSHDNRILSTGYNGTPIGFDDKDFPWQKGSNNPLENKYLFVIHAERNAVLNYRGNMRDLQGSTCYVTHHPCIECFKELVQSGVKTVRYSQEYGDDVSLSAIRIIAEKCGVNIVLQEYNHRP